MVKATKLHRGFTLIELLVVISIIGFGITLVAGFGIEQYERSQARVERLELESELKQFSHRAFHRADTVTLSFDGSYYQANFKHLTSQPPARVFDYLSFEKQTIYFNQAGLPDQLTLKIELAGNTSELKLYRLIGFSEEDAYAEPQGF